MQPQSTGQVNTPRLFFGVQEWDGFVESLYGRVILDVALSSPCTFTSQERDYNSSLETSSKARRKFEAFVWLTVHYFLQALPLPPKAVARGQLKYLQWWVKGDVKYGDRNPFGAAVGSLQRSSASNRIDNVSSDDEDVRTRRARYSRSQPSTAVRDSAKPIGRTNWGSPFTPRPASKNEVPSFQKPQQAGSYGHSSASAFNSGDVGEADDEENN